MLEPGVCLGVALDGLIREVSERLEERGVSLTLTDAAKEALVEEGYDRVYGARPLRRTVERRIENPLARRMLSGEFKDGHHVTVDYVNGEYSFERAAVAEPVGVEV